MAGTSLGEILEQFSLERYYETFTSVGIKNTSHLLALTMQDYPTLGITSMQDRRKMFHLIQNIKDKENLTSKALISKGHHYAKRKDKEYAEIQGQTAIQTPVQPKTTPLRNRNVTTPNAHNFSYGIPASKLKPSTSKSKIDSSNIKVCVRKRPLGSDEIELDEADIVDVETKNCEVVINAPKVAVDLTHYMQKFSFVFDEVFDESFSNHQVYEKTAKPLVNAIFTEGAKATCFAYGCTGSGKTYTMLGTDNVPGLYLLAASDIFNILYSGNHGDDLGLWVSFYEIYCGQLFDLLNDRTKLFARENATHQVCIVGLTERQVKNVEELMEVIESGGNSRSTGSTGVNADSSRSHAILQLDLKHEQEGGSLGRFSFIDLAGSERAADVTDSDKQTRMEGAEINQSLLALKECIRSLDQDSKHTPFRQSKLTQVLKDSFIGNTRTCMIANVSPCQSSCENTLNTLRYADRVKELNKNIAPGPLSPRPVTVHGNIGKDTTSHMTRITNSSLKNKPLGKSLNLNSTQGIDRENTRNKSLTPRTPKAKNKTVLKSLQIPPNTPRQTSLLLSRPETSPAAIREGACKPRSQSRLHQLSKEQSYNMSKTNQQVCLQEKYDKDGNSLHGKQVLNEMKDSKASKHVFSGENKTELLKFSKTKSKFSGPQVRNTQSNQSNLPREKEENVKFSGNRRRNIRRNTFEVLPAENTIEEVKDRPSTPKLRITNTGKINSQHQHAHNTRTQSNKVTSNDNKSQVLQNENQTEEDKQRPQTPKLMDKRKNNRQQRSDQNTRAKTTQSTSNNDKRPNKQKFDILKLDEETETLLSKQGNKADFLDEQDQKPLEKAQQEQKQPKVESKLKTSPDGPQSNHRYSKGIKARLAQLFTSKTAMNSGALPDHKDTTTLTSTSARNQTAPLQRGTTESMTHRVISEEQLVAAHHTQLAMITSLCHEEMVLLKQRENQDFTEYIAQVEEILLQKQTCIQNLQEKLRNWKASSQQLGK